LRCQSGDCVTLAALARKVDTVGCDSIYLVPGVRGTSGGRDGEEKKDGTMGAETDAE
jgi:hypothetical protein